MVLAITNGFTDMLVISIQGVDFSSIGHLTKKLHTYVSLNIVLEYELSLILGPVQNQILYSREPLCVGTLRHSVSK